MKEKNELAVITGASDGIGKAFAKELSGKGYDVLLISRNKDGLEKTAQEIKEFGCGKVDYFVSDLSTSDGISMVAARIGKRDVSILVNNAGFGNECSFASSKLGDDNDMVMVHISATIALAKVALARMLERKRGIIINVSSISAFLPSRNNTMYSGTKAFLVSFTRSLSYELRGTGVTVQVLCPGLTLTNFHNTRLMEQFDTGLFPRFLWMAPDEVVSHSLKRIGKETVCIPGILNKLIVKIPFFFHPFFFFYRIIKGN